MDYRLQNFTSSLYKTTPIIYSIKSHLTFDPEPLKYRVKRILTNAVQRLYDDLTLSKLDRAKQVHKLCQSIILIILTEIKVLEQEIHQNKHQNKHQNNQTQHQNSTNHDDDVLTDVETNDNPQFRDLTSKLIQISVFITSVELLPDWYQQCLCSKEMRNFNALRRSSSALRNSVDEETQYLSNSTSAIRLANQITNSKTKLEDLCEDYTLKIQNSINYSERDCVSVYINNEFYPKMLIQCFYISILSQNTRRIPDFSMLKSPPNKLWIFTSFKLAGFVTKFPTSLLDSIRTAEEIVFDRKLESLNTFSELDHETLTEFSKAVENHVNFLTGKLNDKKFKFPDLDRRVKLPDDMGFDFKMLEKCVDENNCFDGTVLKILFKCVSDVDWARSVKYLAHGEGLSVGVWLGDTHNDAVVGRVREPSRRMSALKRDGVCDFLKDDHKLYTGGLMFVEKVFLLEYLF